MTISELAKRAVKLAADNSPTILTTMGVIGAATTAYLAGKASFEACDIIRLKEADDEVRGMTRLDQDYRDLVKERVQLVWKLYIPAAGSLAFTVSCIIGANHIGSRRAAGLAAAYSLTERSLSEYKDKVVEKLGEKKEQAIQDEIAQDRLNASTITDVQLASIGEHELCFDMYSCLPFTGSVEGIRAAVNTFNNMLNHDGYGSMADFYRMLDTIEVPSYTESIGWNSDRLLDVQFSTTLLHESRPVITIDYRPKPEPDYGRFRG